MRKVGLVILTLCTAFLSINIAEAVEDSPSSRATLKGLPGLFVGVPRLSGCENFGVHSQAIGAEVDFQLQEAGHLVVPYTLDNNDMKFAVPPGFTSGDGFYTYLKDAFDVLYAEGETAPKMMSIGLHCRLAGRPGRAAALARFMDYVLGHDRVWLCRRVDIARHWRETHPFESA